MKRHSFLITVRLCEPILWRTFLFLTVNCLLPTVFFAQSTQGPNNGATFTNDAGAGTVAWNSVSNAKMPDNMYASVNLNRPNGVYFLNAKTDIELFT